MTLVQGSIINHSIKKLKTKISTEKELVGVDDISSNFLWKNYFLQ